MDMYAIFAYLKLVFLFRNRQLHNSGTVDIVFVLMQLGIAFYTFQTSYVLIRLDYGFPLSELYLPPIHLSSSYLSKGGVM